MKVINKFLKVTILLAITLYTAKNSAMVKNKVIPYALSTGPVQQSLESIGARKLDEWLSSQQTGLEEFTNINKKTKYAKPGYIYFYQSDKPYYEFANYYRAAVTIDGKVWPTTEHYFQAMKSTDLQEQEKIRLMQTPDETRRYWQGKKPSTPNWLQQKKLVMLKAVRAKANQNPAIKNLLLATGNQIIVENTFLGKYDDPYWGNGLSDSGDNDLGRIWMQVRAELMGAISVKDEFPYTGQVKQVPSGGSAPSNLITSKPLIQWNPTAIINKSFGNYISVWDFFPYIMGLKEEEFRNQYYGWRINQTISTSNYCSQKGSSIGMCSQKQGPGQGTKSADPKEAWFDFPFKNDRWINQYKNRESIGHGDFKALSIADIDHNIQSENISAKTGGKFSILLHDDNKPEQTDVRDLLADPTNTNAVFQVASTFWGPLEGGQYNWTTKLDGMVAHAVQGEIVSIATAGATIYRKYFMPNVYLLQQLFENEWINSYYWNYTSFKVFVPTLNTQFLEKKAWNDSHANNVQVGIHSDVDVVLGKVHDRKETDRTKLYLEVIQNPHKVDLVLASAYDVSKLKKPINSNIISFAKMILKAAYSGTVRAAALGERKKVYLTMMGAGAFGNELDWLYDAMNNDDFINTIKNYGLDVYLIYRPETRAHRTAQIDEKFLKNMLKIADSVNGTKLEKDNLLLNNITNYISALYAKQTPTVQLMNAINTALTTKITTPHPVPPVIPKPQPTTDTKALTSALNNLALTLYDFAKKLKGQ